MTEASHSEKLRLFFAVRIPDGHLEAIESALEPHRHRFEGARWAPLENQHVTLRFLGSTPGELLDDVIAAGHTAAQVAPADITLTSLGAFPTATRARVLWVGIDDPSGVLGTVAGSLDSALAPLGFEPEARPFVAHLTLARFKVPRRLPADLPEVASALGSVTVDRLALVRSHLHPKGARYEVVAEMPLTAAG